MNHPIRNTIMQIQTEPKGLATQDLCCDKNRLHSGLGLDGQTLYSQVVCSVLPAVVTRVGIGSVNVGAPLPA